MKYGLYIFENHKYKNILISLLPNLNSFLSLFYRCETLAKYILIKKMYKLLELPVDILHKLSVKEAQKTHMLTGYISPQDITLLLLCSEIDKVTKYNYKDIIRFIREYNDIRIGKINVSWGKGNHLNKVCNIYEHFNKHTKDNLEKIYWEQVLEVVTPTSYKLFTENIFKMLDKVVIHSNGRNTYMSGFYNNFFVVGRYHNNIFGISSCYYVEDGEKLGRYVDRCVKIVNI